MSQYYSILDAAKTTLAALPGFAGYSFDIRRLPFCSTDHGDVLPFACLSFTRERLAGMTFKDSWLDYPCYLTIFQAKGKTKDDASVVQAVLDRREEARLALFKGNPLAAVPTCFDCTEYDPDPAFAIQGFDISFDVSQQLFLFRNAEARG